MDDRLQKYNELVMSSHKEAGAPMEKPKETINSTKMDAINNNTKKEPTYSNNPSVTKENNKKANDVYSSYTGYTGYTGSNSSTKSSSTSSGYSYYSGYSNNNQQNKNTNSLDYHARANRVRKRAEERAKEDKKKSADDVYRKATHGFDSFKVKECRYDNRNKVKTTKQLTATTVAIIGEAALGALLLITKSCLGEITEGIKNIVLGK